jgi:tetratricopeptide (TPR) repeat protein
MLDTVVFVDPKAVKYFTDEVILAKVHAEQDTLLAAEHHISGYPTAVLLDGDGEEIDRIVGYREPEEYIQILRDYRKGVGTLADLLNRAETEEDRSLYFEIADKYKYRGGSDRALAWFERVIDAGDPMDSLSGESRGAMANMWYRSKDYERAIESYKAIISDFKTGPVAEDAEVWIPYIHQKKGDTALAIEGFAAFAKSHPESEDAEFALKQIKKLKGEK